MHEYRLRSHIRRQRIRHAADYEGSNNAYGNLRTKIMDFGGVYSSRILILRGGILMSMGNFLEMSSQTNNTLINNEQTTNTYIYNLL